MAYTSCAGNLAQNIAMECDNPLIGGYTGRAVLIQWKDAPTIVKDAQNPRIVRSITLDTNVKSVAIDNVFTTPFDGANTASSADSGRTMYTKQLMVRIPSRGAGASRDVVEPLQTSAGGFLLVVEKKDKKGDGAFEVLGLYDPMKATADGIARNENENGGDITATLQCVEPYFECTLSATGDDYEDTKAMFETLLSASF